MLRREGRGEEGRGREERGRGVEVRSDCSWVGWSRRVGGFRLIV